MLSKGLMIDCTTSSSGQVFLSDTHLPSLSVAALLQLQSALERPRAVALDPRLESGSLTDDFLREQLSCAFEGASGGEARRLLEQRALLEPSDTLRSAAAGPDAHGPAHVQPDQAAETLDISVCALPSLESAVPAVSFVRCEHGLERDDARRATLRCLAPVACSALCVARDMGRALATALMHFRFACEVLRVPRSRPRPT